MLNHPLIFDGHNDTLLRLFQKGEPQVERLFLNGSNGGQIDLPRAVEGGFAGGLFAIFVPPCEKLSGDRMLRKDGYDMPLPNPISASDALPSALGMAAILLRIERESAGRVRICRTTRDIRACLESDRLAAVMHLEGAEPIDEKFDALDVFYEAGLRSIGPVWSRPNLFGCGVPFRFPSSPDTGPGLTELGKDLIRVCNERRILIDLSHLNANGFWDVARLSKAPLVASHSNAHTLCAHARNLTDTQLGAIRDSGGLVGLTFSTSFIRADGQRNAHTSLDVLVDHLEYLIERVGVDHLGFGSDFDGALVPEAIGDVSGLGRLRDALSARGYSGDVLKRLCHGNWLSVLERTWGA